MAITVGRFDLNCSRKQDGSFPRCPDGFVRALVTRGDLARTVIPDQVYHQAPGVRQPHLLSRSGNIFHSVLLNCKDVVSNLCFIDKDPQIIQKIEMRFWSEDRFSETVTRW